MTNQTEYDQATQQVAQLPDHTDTTDGWPDTGFNACTREAADDIHTTGATIIHLEPGDGTRYTIHISNQDGTYEIHMHNTWGINGQWDGKPITTAEAHRYVNGNTPTHIYTAAVYARYLNQLAHELNKTETPAKG